MEWVWPPPICRCSHVLAAHLQPTHDESHIAFVMGISVGAEYTCIAQHPFVWQHGNHCTVALEYWMALHPCVTLTEVYPRPFQPIRDALAAVGF